MQVGERSKPPTTEKVVIEIDERDWPSGCARRLGDGAALR
jgi:hypothetical protein